MFYNEREKSKEKEEENIEESIKIEKWESVQNLNNLNEEQVSFESDQKRESMMSNKTPSPLAVVYSPSKLSEAVPKKSLSMMDENSFNLLI